MQSVLPRDAMSSGGAQVSVNARRWQDWERKRFKIKRSLLPVEQHSRKHRRIGKLQSWTWKRIGLKEMVIREPAVCQHLAVSTALPLLNNNPAELSLESTVIPKVLAFRACFHPCVRGRCNLGGGSGLICQAYAILCFFLKVSCCFRQG